MDLEFAKMHGLGNDFVVFDGVRQEIGLTPERIRAISDRRFGVGCDQVLVVEPAERAGVDFRYRIHNADGGEVEQCGNGARCVAAFIHATGLSDARELRVVTLGGDIDLTREADGRVTVAMGEPRLAGEFIPLREPGEHLSHGVDLSGRRWTFTAVSVGNPHAVIEVADAVTAPVAEVGPLLEHDELFPYGANVEFVEIRGLDRLRVRVWERGAGETLACGTGAMAAQVASRLWGRTGPTAAVELDGGTLTIHWPGRGEAVTMTGPAELVYWGRLSGWPNPRPASAAHGRRSPEPDF
ncbi:diaminopimelate epimerase [Thiohalorhabdus sp.]|uniref:diaminopimelate epimerase n=1 Tax=Thiohalorhabdus sp. TaxID=3094134 RepID=UPI002FC340C3